MKWINVLAFFAIILLSHQTSAQVYSYRYNNKEEGLSSSYETLSFSIGTNYYELNCSSTMSGGGCAQMVSEQLSYGFVMRDNNTIILHDVRGSYNMKVEITDSSLKVTKGFEAFKNINFNWGGKFIQRVSDEKIYVKYYDDNLNRKTTLDSVLFNSDMSLNRNDTPLYKFSKGFYAIAYKYTEPTTDSSYLHLLFDNNTYKYKLGEMLLTEGIWKQIGNYILLKDHTLNSYFILRMTGNNRMITEVFPYANWNLTFALAH